MGAAEVCPPRDHHTGVGDRLLERCEIDAWIAGRVMSDGRQEVAIGLRDVLSRDSATWSRQRRRGRRARTLSWPEFEVPVATFDCRFCSRNRCPYWTPEASGKPCGVDRELTRAFSRGGSDSAKRRRLRIAGAVASAGRANYTQVELVSSSGRFGMCL